MENANYFLFPSLGTDLPFLENANMEHNLKIVSYTISFLITHSSCIALQLNGSRQQFRRKEEKYEVEEEEQV